MRAHRENPIGRWSIPTGTRWHLDPDCAVRGSEWVATALRRREPPLEPCARCVPLEGYLVRKAAP